MANKLTLDEVNVEPDDAAQVIYDLRRALDAYRSVLRLWVGGDPDARATTVGLLRREGVLDTWR